MGSEWLEGPLEYFAAPEKGSIAIGPFGSRMKADCYVEKGVALIRGTNLGQGRSLSGEFVFITPEKAAELGNANLKPGDLVFPHRGAIGEVGIVPDDGRRYALSTSLMKITLDSRRAIPDFYYYFFKSTKGQYELLKNASQVGTPGIATPLKSLRECVVTSPSFSEQASVVAVLRCLDNRIDLLRQTNTTLEAIAQALFKSWFVDFDPVHAKAEGREPEAMDAATAALFPSEFEGSEFGQIPKGWCASQFGNVLTETSDRVKERATTVMSAVQTGNLVKSDDHFNKRVHSADISKYKLVPMLSFAYNPSRINIGSIGLNESNGLGAVSPIYVVAKPRSKDIAYLIWHHLRAGRTKSAIETLCSGSVRQSLSAKDFMSLPLVLPDSDTLTRFMGIRRALYQKVVAGSEQIASLADLRDTLLPRLISGKLRLPESTEAAEAALA